MENVKYKFKGNIYDSYDAIKEDIVQSVYNIYHQMMNEMENETEEIVYNEDEENEEDE